MYEHKYTMRYYSPLPIRWKPRRMRAFFLVTPACALVPQRDKDDFDSKAREVANTSMRDNNHWDLLKYLLSGPNPCHPFTVIRRPHSFMFVPHLKSKTKG